MARKGLKTELDVELELRILTVELEPPLASFFTGAPLGSKSKPAMTTSESSEFSEPVRQQPKPRRWRPGDSTRTAPREVGSVGPAK
mmetsp:Transcript_59142/g.106326  ORF Transcript_59142/g.106326 Transcript_59142/m.106326 type:complete len:86 (-) Transcript_59142:369-626(-)